jgi:RNA polymerase sigma factor (sigma-70 family)
MRGSVAWCASAVLLSRGALPAFLFETARNLCLHRHRTAGRDARALERFGSTNASAGAPDPLDALIAARDIENVQRALAALDERDRDVLLWSYRDGLDTVQIGERLAISPGAVRVRRHRALTRLATALGVTLAAKREHK